MSDPTFRTIANLFAVPLSPDTDEESPARPRVGRTAAESDALGTASLNDGNFESAIRYFRKAVEQRDSSDVSSRLNLAGALAFAGQVPQAYRQYQLALEQNSASAEARFGISDALRQYGRFSDAIQVIAKAVEMDPTSPHGHLKLAEALRDAGFPKRALESAQRAVIAKPDDAYYHYFVGDILVELRRFDEALDSFQAAIELSPGDDYLYERAAVAFWQCNRRTEAIKAIRLASDLDPDKALYHGILYEFLFEAGLKEESELERASADRMDEYDKERLMRVLIDCGIEEA